MPNPALLSFLDKYPPFLIYAMARTGKRGPCCAREKRPSIKTMVFISGLSETTLLRMSRAMTWKPFTVEAIDGFCAACGVSLLHMEKHIRFWKRAVQNGLCHLSKSQQSSLYLRTIRWRMLNEASGARQG